MDNIFQSNKILYFENNIDYCLICDFINTNIYIIIHCKKCNKCHYKHKIYCNNCKNCYDPLLDKDLIKHRKICKLKILKN